MPSIRRCQLSLLFVCLLACGDGGNTPLAVDAGRDGSSADAGMADDLLRLPRGFPAPLIPEDNPLSVEKVELGRRLFYDKRLSANGTQSCATCHEQAKAFTDGKARALGSTGEEHPRSAMSLANVAYLSVLTWGNPLMTDLELQTLAPMFGKAPVELGLVDEPSLLAVLRDVPYYQTAFAAAYPDESEPLTLRNVVRAITSFERTLISGDSPYDRWLWGDDTAISESAKRGYALFNGHPFECFHCHGEFAFTDATRYANNPDATPRFHNTGLYNVGGDGSYPAPNTGIHAISGVASDMGKFRAPSLRNIAVTAPYMHDGSIATLSEVLDHYAAGGRTLAAGPSAGVGSENPYKDNLIKGFVLSEQDRADAIAFLESLTDDGFLHDTRFANPWTDIDAARH